MTSVSHEPRDGDSAEIVSAALLAAATVASAWCGYQAALWNGEQTRPGATVHGDLLGAEEDGDGVGVGADDDALADQLGRQRVEVAVEADAEALGDACALDIVRVERHDPPLLVSLADVAGHLESRLTRFAVHSLPSVNSRDHAQSASLHSDRASNE
jgi:hypothetical protein